MGQVVGNNFTKTMLHKLEMHGKAQCDSSVGATWQIQLNIRKLVPSENIQIPV